MLVLYFTAYIIATLFLNGQAALGIASSYPLIVVVVVVVVVVLVLIEDHDDITSNYKLL